MIKRYLYLGPALSRLGPQISTFGLSLAHLSAGQVRRRFEGVPFCRQGDSIDGDTELCSCKHHNSPRMTIMVAHRAQLSGGFVRAATIARLGHFGRHASTDEVLPHPVRCFATLSPSVRTLWSTVRLATDVARHRTSGGNRARRQIVRYSRAIPRCGSAAHFARSGGVAPALI